MNGRYLIPANSKKSELRLGLFNNLDLIIFGIGLGTTLFLLILNSSALHIESFWFLLLILVPLLLAVFLVIPLSPHYHNVLTVLINIYTFFFVRQRTYKWRGWCYKNGNGK